jgi:hypothetical protein
MKKPQNEFQSETDPEITFKIKEVPFNFMITFFKDGKLTKPLGEYATYASLEQGLEAAKRMAESTIKEYLSNGK